MSCAHDVKTQSNDLFEIDVTAFGRSLHTTMLAEPATLYGEGALGNGGDVGIADTYIEREMV